MIIQAHLGIIMAVDVMLGWRDKQAVGKIWRFLSNFSAKNLLIKSHKAHQIVKMKHEKNIKLTSKMQTPQSSSPHSAMNFHSHLIRLRLVQQFGTNNSPKIPALMRASTSFSFFQLPLLHIFKYSKATQAGSM
jgi:hypothetical protein